MKYLIPQFNDVITLKEDVVLTNTCRFYPNGSFWYSNGNKFIEFLGGKLPAGTKLKVATQNDIYSGTSFRLVYGTEVYNKLVEFAVDKTVLSFEGKKVFTQKNIKYSRFSIPSNVLETIEMEIERK